MKARVVFGPATAVALLARTIDCTTGGMLSGVGVMVGVRVLPGVLVGVMVGVRVTVRVLNGVRTGGALMLSGAGCTALRFTEYFCESPWNSLDAVDGR